MAKSPTAAFRMRFASECMHSLITFFEGPIVRPFLDACIFGAGLGCLYLLVATFLVRRFPHEPDLIRVGHAPVTILKPLHGDEPDLLSRLSGFCSQKYAGRTQVVFGCQDCRDDAIPVARRLQSALPDLEIDLIVGGPDHGSNRKISNLINMAAAARHDVLVMADSDIEVGPLYLSRVIAALEKPGVGAVSCLYHGIAGDSLPAAFAAHTINAHFIPNVLVALALRLGRPCFGATIALRREVLNQIGTFRAFADKLADDHAIGEAVRAAGHRVIIPPFSVGHVCHEKTFQEFFSRTLRCARTIRSLNPVGYAGAIITNPLPLALLGMLGGDNTALALVIAAIASRIMLCRSTEQALGAPPQQSWVLITADLALFVVFVVSFFGSSVTWRGHRYQVMADGSLFQDPN